MKVKAVRNFDERETVVVMAGGGGGRHTKGTEKPYYFTVEDQVTDFIVYE